MNIPLLSPLSYVDVFNGGQSKVEVNRQRIDEGEGGYKLEK
jgi:hypothetical protein